MARTPPKKRWHNMKNAGADVLGLLSFLPKLNGFAAVNLSFSFRTPSISRLAGRLQESGTTINRGNENSLEAASNTFLLKDSGNEDPVVRTYYGLVLTSIFQTICWELKN